ncbi:MAG: tryptophan synthase subunit alpha [Armatimonadota bacterium]|nr:tryptophan synthase subunit alpha [Armatimonadota bacterium]
MSRIRETFTRLRAAGRIALIPFVMAGDPDLGTTEELLPKLVEAGADLIEVGIPFSDPIADGPVNQRAAQRALAAGATPREILALCRRIRERTDVPLILLSYYNPLLRYGVAPFCRDARNAGVDGLVVPDLPPDEAGELVAAARDSGLDTVFLAAPTSTEERIELVCRLASGFVYCVSLTGVTGPRREINKEAITLLARLRERTSLPLVLGFGISTPAQVREVAKYADGVIVGSALIQAMEEAGPQGIEAAMRFLSQFRQALNLTPSTPSEVM